MPISDKKLTAVGFEEVRVDGTRQARLRWQNAEPSLEQGRDRAVTGPGDSAANAADREPRSGRQNWVPIGPRNIGGRITALAIDPTKTNVMYAGTPAGGVFKTIDKAETWFPLWHDQPTLSIAAIAIAGSKPDRIWVATGDAHPGGGGFIDGDGIYLSDDAGETWERKAAVAASGVPGARRFEAIAADPSDEDFCFAVAEAGIYWTQNGGTDWERYTENHVFTDVAYTDEGAPKLYIVAVAEDDAHDTVIIRIDDPRDRTAGAIAAALADPPNRTTLPDVGGTSLIADHPVVRGRIGLTKARHAVVYAHFTRNYLGNDGEEEAGHFVLARCDSATTAPWSAQPWAAAGTHPNWTVLDRWTDKPQEGQGGYNLTLAVDPTDESRVATGMVDLYVTTDGTAAAPTWRRAMAWELYHLDRGHHADHHALVFDPTAADPDLWAGQDGGLSVSDDWHRRTADYALKTDLDSGPQTARIDPDDVVTWHKRSHGLDNVLPYDLAQSPIVPTLYGCGFQDNGVFLTTGGPTWQFIVGADGGHIAFDTDDPYQMLVTWQGGLAHVEMPGRLLGTLPLPGNGVIEALWARQVIEGFLETDGEHFVPDTSAHPRQSGRYITARENRIYVSDPARSGENWLPARVGPTVDLVARPRHRWTHIDVLASPAAHALGFEPQRSQVGFLTARIRTNTAEPYHLREGDRLDIAVNGAAHQITFRSRPADGLAVDSMSALELAAEIERQTAGALGFSALPGLRPAPTAVELIADPVGGGPSEIEILPASTALADLELSAGTYLSAPNHPAVIRLPHGADLRAVGGGGPLDLRFRVNGGAALHRVDLDVTSLPYPHWVHATELAAMINRQLAGRPVRAEAVASSRGVNLTATDGVELELSDTARARLGLPQTLGRSTATITGTTNDLSPVPQQLTITDGANSVTAVFDPVDFADIANATSAEIRDVIDPLFTAAGIEAVVRVDPAGPNVEFEANPGHALDFSGSAMAALSAEALTPTTDAARKAIITGTPDLTALSLTLDLRDGATVANIVFDAAAPIADRANATLAELRTVIDAAIAASGIGLSTNIFTTQVELEPDPGVAVAVSGTARGTLGLPRLFPVGETASMMGAFDFSPTDLELHVDDGTNSFDLVFDGTHGIVALDATTPAELHAVLDAEFTAAGILGAVRHVVGPPAQVEITANAGITITATGTAAEQIDLDTPVVAGTPRLISGDRYLDPTPRLTVNDPAAARSVSIDIDATSGVVDLQKVRPSELLRVLEFELRNNGIRATANTIVEHDAGEATAIQFDPARPNRVWAASLDGAVFASDDAGATWRGVEFPPTVEIGRAVEAIAFHPTEARTVYIGLIGWQIGEDPGFIYRSEDDGGTWEAVGADVENSDGEPVPVRGLAVDPVEPDHLYAGSDAGVFHTTNRGRSWNGINEGLPNARVFDLIMEPRTRTLRAAVWGRRLFERHVGTRRAEDVQLVVRANVLDDGTVRPPPVGADLLARRPRSVVQYESPDIKVSRSIPGGAFLDGVEFDEDFEHQEPTSGPHTIAVQVNNRGAFPADDVRIVALWTDASLGVPPLPDDFWETFGAGALGAQVGEWHVALDETLRQPPVSPRHRVAPGYPRVLTANVDFPADVEEFERIGFLAIATCPDDELAGPETDVECLLASDRRVAYRESKTVRTVDYETLHIVGRAADQTVPFSVTSSSPPSALAAVGLATPASPVVAMTGGREDYNLTSGAGDRGLLFSYPVRHVVIQVADADFQDAGEVWSDELATVLNRELIQQRVPLKAHTVDNAPAPDELEILALDASTRFVITGGSIAAETRLPTGGATTSSVRSARLVYALDRPGMVLNIDLHVAHTVRFDQNATAGAEEVRTRINRSMAEQNLPIRAVIPRVALAVRRSINEGTGGPVVTARGTLADLVTSDVAVAPADRGDLFPLTVVLDDDELIVGRNFLYLRSTNTGNADQADARHRLWEVKFPVDAGDPLTLEPIGESQEDVPAGGAQITQFEWTPADPAATTGERRVVLSAVDHIADRPLNVSPGTPLEDGTTFASLEELDQLCRRHPAAAYREFLVG